MCLRTPAGPHHPRSQPRGVNQAEEAAERALSEALADMEHALAASATTIARHTAGGVAMPRALGPSAAPRPPAAPPSTLFAGQP